MFGFKTIILAAFILVIDTKLINGAPQFNGDRAPECEWPQIVKCEEQYRNLTVITNISSKEDLNVTCLKFDESLSCINSIKDLCMKEDERNRFNGELTRVVTFLKELCKEGAYQEEFLRNVPCMHRAANAFEICDRKRRQRIEWYNTVNTTVDSLRRVCCTYEEYVKCTNKAMRETCGEKITEFSESFRDKLIARNRKSDCAVYKDKCGLSDADLSPADLS